MPDHNVEKESQTTSCRIQQDSTLGPLRTSQYINDLRHSSSFFDQMILLAKQKMKM